MKTYTLKAMHSTLSENFELPETPPIGADICLNGQISLATIIHNTDLTDKYLENHIALGCYARVIAITYKEHFEVQQETVHRYWETILTVKLMY